MPQRRRREEADALDSPAATQGPATQRRRTTDVASDDEVLSDAENNDATQGDSLDDMVKKLVRLALACEYQRRPIRRTEISEKVLGDNGRQFKAVWARAQDQLSHVFGMEMFELPAREKVTLQQKRAAQKAPQNKPTISWIVMTKLPSEFRDPVVLQPPAVPTSTEDSKYTGIYTLLVSLISLSGGSLPDAKMERCLTRLQMEDRTPLTEYDRTEKLIKRMEKDGYIMKVKESSGTGDDDIYWIVGPRGKVEVGENGVRGLARTVFGSMESEADEDELERKIARSLGLNDKSDINTSAAAPRVESRRRSRRGQDDEDEDMGHDDDDGEDG